jgi:hypothetical protein
MLCYYISRYNREKIMRYEMTEHCITVSNTPVYQVRYLTDSPDHGGKGSLGGYIRDEVVLPQDGTGVVLGDAVVTGGTVWGGTVLGNAMVAGGTIHGGEIHGGEILDGSIYGGEIHGGEIRNGSIYDGVIYGGEIYGGVVYGGVIYGGEIRNGSIYGGEIRNGVICGGEIHRGSVIHGGVVYGGIWHCGPLTMYPGRHPMCVCDYNTLKIGCCRRPLGYWLTNADVEGRIDGMHDANIELYVRMIDTAKRWHDYVTNEKLLLPQKPY